LLGNLNNFSPNNMVVFDQMPNLEKYLLRNISNLNTELKSLVKNHDYHGIYLRLLNFCTLDLSAFYFDIRKDSLYCDHINSHKRKSVTTCLHIVFEFLTKWLSPVISFTAEEAWLSRNYNNSESILMQTIKHNDFIFKDDHLEEMFNELKRIRKCVTASLELKRNEKVIGSSLQANVKLYITSKSQNLLKDIDLAEMCIVSNLEIHDISNKTENSMNFEEDDIFVEILLADGEKCDRCWTILPEVEGNPNKLCKRCDDVWQTFQ
jgi:isoleucyl-tRNA synthetase